MISTNVILLIVSSNKAEAVLMQAWTGFWGFRRYRLPEFVKSLRMNMSRWSRLNNGRLYLPPTPNPMEIPLEEASWNVMAQAHKPDFVFRRNGREHLNRRGRQFSRLLAAEVCASAVVMLDTPCSEVMWRVLATHSIRQFPLHFPSSASPCAITFQLDSTHFC